jgi:hypothetical protein
MDNFKPGAVYPFTAPLDAAPVLVAVKRTSDGQYLDFADNAFKPDGHAARQAALTSDGTSLVYQWNTTGLTTAATPVLVEWTMGGDVLADAATLNTGGSGASVQDMVDGGIAQEATLAERPTLAQMESSALARTSQLPPAPDNAGISSAAAAAASAAASASSAAADTATLIARLTSTRAALLNNLTLLDVAVGTRLATAAYVAADNVSIQATLTAIQHATYGLSALRTAINGIGASIDLSSVQASIQEVLDALAAFPNVPDLSGLMTQVADLHSLTEEDGAVPPARRLTSKALERTYRIPSELELVRAQYPNLSVAICYQITKEFTPPDPTLNIVAVRVHRAVDPLGPSWPVLEEQPYTQGQGALTFVSQYTGFFKLSFVDADGEQGELSETFATSNVYEDIDLKFKLEKDSQRFIVGDQRYLTVTVTDRDGVLTQLPSARMTVRDSAGKEIVRRELALCDGMQIKYLLATDDLSPGTYTVRAEVNTTFEIIQSSWLEFSLNAA